MVAVCALLLALGAAGVAVYSLDVAREAKSQAAMAASRGEPVAPTGQPTATPTPAPPTATQTATPAPVPTFAPIRLRAEVAIPVPQGCVSAFVDVDALEVGVDAGHEFYLSRCQGPLVFRIDRADGAVSVPTGASPQECVQQIASTSTAGELVLLARSGLSFCLLTADRPEPPQLVSLIDVRSVDEDDSVVVTVSTYRMPG